MKKYNISTLFKFKFNIVQRIKKTFNLLVMDNTEKELVGRIKDNLKKSLLSGKELDPQLNSLMEASINDFVDITWSTAKRYFELRYSR